MIQVCSTVAPYVMDQKDTSLAWLYGAEELRANCDEEVTFFAAIETDARGLEPFGDLIERLADLSLPSVEPTLTRPGPTFWTFQFDDGATEYNTETRNVRIVTGQNLVTQRAADTRASHLLFMAADCKPPADALPKLLEMDWPIVGGEVSTYCLKGPAVKFHPTTKKPFEFPVQQHMTTSAFVMLRRDLFKRIVHRVDRECGMTDDPCLHYDAEQLGYPTLVRKDVIGQHYPMHVPAVEHRGHKDRSIHKK